MARRSETANNGYEGDLEITDIPKSFIKDILGLAEDGNGALIENKDNSASEFALGFEIQGDDKARRVWFYRCTASRPSVDGKTIEASKEALTDKLTLTISPRTNDGQIKAVMELSTTNTTEYNGFFSAVYEQEV